jgi:hypothetical protein
MEIQITITAGQNVIVLGDGGPAWFILTDKQTWHEGMKETQLHGSTGYHLLI